jgi:hypothetical protein
MFRNRVFTNRLDTQHIQPRSHCTVQDAHVNARATLRTSGLSLYLHNCVRVGTCMHTGTQKLRQQIYITSFPIKRERHGGLQSKFYETPHYGWNGFRKSRAVRCPCACLRDPYARVRLAFIGCSRETHRVSIYLVATEPEFHGG